MSFIEDDLDMMGDDVLFHSITDSGLEFNADVFGTWNNSIEKPYGDDTKHEPNHPNGGSNRNGTTRRTTFRGRGSNQQSLKRPAGPISLAFVQSQSKKAVLLNTLLRAPHSHHPINPSTVNSNCASSSTSNRESCTGSGDLLHTDTDPLSATTTSSTSPSPHLHHHHDTQRSPHTNPLRDDDYENFGSRYTDDELMAMYPSLFCEAFNDGDSRKLARLIRAFCVPHIQTTYRYAGSPEISYSGKYIEVAGREALGWYWGMLIRSVPDGLFEIQETRLRKTKPSTGAPNGNPTNTPADVEAEGGFVIVNRFMYAGTKVFRLGTCKDDILVFSSDSTYYQKINPTGTNESTSQNNHKGSPSLFRVRLPTSSTTSAFHLKTSSVAAADLVPQPAPIQLAKPLTGPLNAPLSVPLVSSQTIKSETNTSDVFDSNIKNYKLHENEDVSTTRDATVMTQVYPCPPIQGLSHNGVPNPSTGNVDLQYIQTLLRTSNSSTHNSASSSTPESHSTLRSTVEPSNSYSTFMDRSECDETTPHLLFRDHEMSDQESSELPLEDFAQCLNDQSFPITVVGTMKMSVNSDRLIYRIEFIHASNTN